MFHLQYKLSSKTHRVLVIIFLALLGTHLLDNRIYIFTIASLFLIDWKNLKIDTFSTLLLVAFVVSIYIILYISYKDFLLHSHIAIKSIPTFILMVLMYLLGGSITIQYNNNIDITVKISFYLLFSFFIAYSIMIIYSYFAIKQDMPLTWKGLFVNFPNQYSQTDVNGGRLISTIIAYYLTISSILFAYLVIYFDKIRKRKIFSFYEIAFFILVSLFSLYIAALMGRRTTIVLFIGIFILLLFIRILFDSTRKEKIYITLTIFLGTIAFYFLFEDFLIEKFSYIYTRLTHQGLKAARFSFWIPGLKIILHYPLGGGHLLSVSKGMQLAHNTWIDIGKDYGIIPFALFIISLISLSPQIPFKPLSLL